VAQVGERRVTKGELADFFYERFREQWAQAAEALVEERLVAAERVRLTVSVPVAALDAAVEAEAKARAEQGRARFGPGADLAESVRSYYGLDVETWKRRVLRPRLETVLALHRVVRLSQRLRERVTARVIVVRDRAKADLLAAKLARGADFSLTALEESIDPSRASGGTIAPVSRGDLPVPAIEQALFSAAPGALVGPIEVATAGGLEVHLYKVVARDAPWTGDAGALAARLEADLAATPVTAAEVERWSVRVRREYGVRWFAPDGSALRLPGVAR
jgi:parvulin-like peptidyl-prolyl isomerase